MLTHLREPNVFSYHEQLIIVFAKKRLPSPMFHYIDGGAEDEWTLRRNTECMCSRIGA